MASVKITTSVAFTDADGVQHEPLTATKTITVDGGSLGAGVSSIAAGGTKVLMDLTNALSPIADFDVLVIVAEECEDGKVMLELTTDVGGTIRTASVCLAKDVPFVLGADDSYNNTSANFAGTLDVIQKAEVKNTSSGTAARVRLFAAT